MYAIRSYYEYSYLKDMIEDAIIARKEKGLLGDKIGGLEGFDFDIRNNFV